MPDQPHLQTTVAGIPCGVVVTDYTPGLPAKLHGHPDTWAPAEETYFEWHLVDRKGYPAKWLEKKLTTADCSRIEAGLESQQGEDDDGH